MRHITRTVMTLLLFLISSLAVANPVNINTADADMLAQELKGIGKVRAEAIIQYRTVEGDFMSPEELTKVDGIGEKILEENRDKITVEDEPVTAQN